MTPIEIQFELRKRGITQKKIAEDLGIHEVNVGRIILGKLNSARGIDFISKLIGLDPRKVFPRYFARDKKRCRKAA